MEKLTSAYSFAKQQGFEEKIDGAKDLKVRLFAKLLRIRT
jgi:hypothetical protein